VLKDIHICFGFAFLHCMIGLHVKNWCHIQSVLSELNQLWLAHFVSKKWSFGAQWLIAAEAYPGFCSVRQLGVFLLPLDGMLIHHRSLPRNLLGFPNNSPVPFLYSWVEWGTVRVKCLAQEQKHTLCVSYTHICFEVWLMQWIVSIINKSLTGQSDK